MNKIVLIAIISWMTQARCKSSTRESKSQQHKQATIPVNYNKLSKEEVQEYYKQIQAYYDTAMAKKGFNGSILIAKNGTILFEKYEGFINPATKQRIIPTTSFHIASVTKTFTALTILRLWEQGRIGLEDKIEQYIPNFPYSGITIKMLLNHRSGLPEYLHVMDTLNNTGKYYTNEDVINYIIHYKPLPQALPDKRFLYCNTNYFLLASIIERITRKSFPDYMKDSVFTPLGLQNTFVFSIKDTTNYTPTYSARWAVFPIDEFDCTYGDKNIYSTPQDLFKWDKALYTQHFVSQKTLDMAFTPCSFEKPSKHNYGLGWRLLIHEGDTLVYHNGRWHGSNAVFTRLRKDTATIIVLGNKYNRAIYEARNMATIFSQKNENLDLED